jgi:hypothetical protein
VKAPEIKDIVAKYVMDGVTVLVSSSTYKNKTPEEIQQKMDSGLFRLIRIGGNTNEETHSTCSEVNSL